MVAFEQQNRIHNVFQHFRSGDAAFLVDVPDQYDRRAAFLGIAQQRSRRFSDLRDASRGGFSHLSGNRLNGIHNEQIGFEVGKVHEYFFEGCFADEPGLLIAARDAFSPHF